MLKKILFGVPLLCLSLQSTGYAAGTVVKELAEFGVPAARRAMSSFRQLALFRLFNLPSLRTISQLILLSDTFQKYLTLLLIFTKYQEKV